MLNCITNHIFVKKKIAVKHHRNLVFLLLTEGHAVGALIHSGVCLMSAHHDTLQRAVVLVGTVVCTLSNGAFDALVGIAIHSLFLLFFVILKVCPKTQNQSVFFN